MALIHRQKTGEGQYLDLSQLAAAMYYTSETYKTPDGKLGPLPNLDQGQMGLGPLNRLYKTNDDWLCICCEKDDEWLALCRALDLSDLSDDPQFNTETQRDSNRDKLASILEERFLTKTSSDWFDQLDKSGAPCEIPIMNGEERLLQTPEYVKSGLVVEHKHPIWSLMREIGTVIGFSETPGVVQGIAPRVGEHTKEILDELGYSDPDIEKLLESGVIAVANKITAPVD